LYTGVDVSPSRKLGLVGDHRGGDALLGQFATAQFLHFVEDDGADLPGQEVGPSSHLVVVEDDHIGVAVVGHLGGEVVRRTATDEVAAQPRQRGVELAQPLVGKRGQRDHESGQRRRVPQHQQRGERVVGNHEVVGDVEPIRMRDRDAAHRFTPHLLHGGDRTGRHLAGSRLCGAAEGPPRGGQADGDGMVGAATAGNIAPFASSAE